MSGVKVVAHLETVVDLGGRCDWCDDPLEPGEVVARHPDTGKRVHEQGCLADQQHGYHPRRHATGAAQWLVTSAWARCSRRLIVHLPRCMYPG